MDRIREKIEEANKNKGGALIIYITCGFPYKDSTVDIVKGLVEGGADVVELGIPFSDPIADGRIIQEASQKALQQKVNTDDCFSTVKKIRENKIGIPILFMGYYNTIFTYGEKRFVERAKQVGLDGFIVPDLPLEESKRILNLLKKFSLSMPFLITPTTTEDRIKKIVSLSSGFIYLVPRLGITGEKTEDLSLARSLVKKVRNYTSLPICIGFGIENKKDVDQIFSFCEGAIIGSKFIQFIEKNPSSENARLFVEKLLS